MGIRRDDIAGGITPHGALILAAIFVGAALVLTTDLPRAHANTVQTNASISVCGNLTIDPGEACDDGPGNNTGGYGTTTSQRHCLPGCVGFGPYCGDGILQVRFDEQCDQGGANSSTGLCSPSCVSLPAVPPGAPPRVVGPNPQVPGVPPGIIPSNQTQVILRGKAYPNTIVHILLDGKVLGTVLADSNADFQFSSTDIAPGTETVSFWATDYAGVNSLTTSVVFDVVQSAVTSVSNIFLPPSISLSSQKIAPGSLLTLFGQSVPTAKVISSIDTDTSNALAAIADGAGKWALQLDTASLTQGFHSVKTSFILSTTSKSGFGKSLNFFVGNQLPAGGTTPDLNGDKKINLVDFSIFLLSWNTHDVRSDFNQDGIVNLADFSILLFNWTG